MDPPPPVPRQNVDQRLWHVLTTTALVSSCFVIARPFLATIAWGVILAVTAWPGFVRLRAALGGRKRLAATAFVLAGMIVLVAPLIIAGLSAAHRAPAAIAFIDGFERNGLPGPPDAVANLPLLGPRLHDIWARLSQQGTEVLTLYRAEINGTARWLLIRSGSFGMVVLQFAAAIIIAGLLLVRAERSRTLLQSFASRVGGQPARDLLPVAEHAIRAVSFGVVGTALAEAILSAIGYSIAGQRAAILLGGVTFLVCLLQAGPGLVFLSAAAWVWYQGSPAWAVFILAWHILLVLPIELFGRPIFISRGTGLPIWLIFIGVVGGLLAFGLIGVFVGATVLAISYRLLVRWLVPDKTRGAPSVGHSNCL